MKSGILRKSRHHGYTLIVVLVLLVFVLVLGINVVNRSSSQERMASQSFDRALAMQAVDGALRDAEAWIEATKPTPTTLCEATTVVAGTTVMVCPPPDPTATPRWEDPDFTSWTAGEAKGSGTLELTPEYFVEYLGSSFPCTMGSSTDSMSCKRYRITARQANTAGRASVMLQSVYATE